MEKEAEEARKKSAETGKAAKEKIRNAMDSLLKKFD